MTGVTAKFVLVKLWGIRNVEC